MKPVSLFILTFLFTFVLRAQTFTNPLLPSGADPYSFYKDGFYYYTHTTGNRLELWKARNLAELKDAPHQTIWKPAANTAWSKEIWAPEVMFLQGKWYAYFAADDGENRHHRMYVLENASADPFKGTWVFKGQVNDASNKWATGSCIMQMKSRGRAAVGSAHQGLSNFTGKQMEHPILVFLYKQDWHRQNLQIVNKI